MTKRELIDQIVSKNQTAEPAFLAQFSDGQLREYLTHLEWLRQPRLRGDASRFERYFRTGPWAASPSGHWRTASDVPAAPTSPPARAASADVSRRESLDLSARPVPPPAEAPNVAPAPAEAPATGMTLLPPIQELDFEGPLPADAETLEAMQLSPEEREVLTTPVEGPGDTDELPAPPPLEPGPNLQAAPSSFADTATDEQVWLF